MMDVNELLHVISACISFVVLGGNDIYFILVPRVRIRARPNKLLCVPTRCAVPLHMASLHCAHAHRLQLTQDV